MTSLQLYESYSFWFFSDGIRISVSFLGPFEWRFTGADHTYPHLIRRSWAQELIFSHPDAWRALPTHEYIDVLHNRGFDYDEYMIQRDNSEIHIICRSVTHLL